MNLDSSPQACVLGSRGNLGTALVIRNGGGGGQTGLNSEIERGNEGCREAEKPPLK